MLLSNDDGITAPGDGVRGMGVLGPVHYRRRRRRPRPRRARSRRGPPGLRALASALAAADFCTFCVAAPSGERSAQSHCISLGKHLHAWELPVGGAEEAFAVDGTPADSVMIALYGPLLKVGDAAGVGGGAPASLERGERARTASERASLHCTPASHPPPPHPPRPPPHTTPAPCQNPAFDLVVSGINRGDNCGLHVIYSGTVGAAREAACKVRPRRPTLPPCPTSSLRCRPPTHRCPPHAPTPPTPLPPQDIPAIALSLDSFAARSEEQYATAARYAVALVRGVLGLLPPTAARPLFTSTFCGAVLNVNIPRGEAEELRGYYLAHQGQHCHYPEFQVGGWGCGVGGWVGACPHCRHCGAAPPPLHSACMHACMHTRPHTCQTTAHTRNAGDGGRPARGGRPPGRRHDPRVPQPRWAPARGPLPWQRLVGGARRGAALRCAAPRGWLAAPPPCAGRLHGAAAAAPLPLALCPHACPPPPPPPHPPLQRQVEQRWVAVTPIGLRSDLPLGAAAAAQRQSPDLLTALALVLQAAAAEVGGQVGGLSKELAAAAAAAVADAR